MKFPKFHLPLRRGGRTEDEVEDEKVEEEEEELGEVRGLGRTSTASLPVAPISAARPLQKKRSRLLTIGVTAFLLVICSICALVYLAIPDAGSQVDISALPPSTQTAVWIETKVAEVATQYAPRTPVLGQGSSDVKATPSVVKAPISGGLGPTATATVTSTVAVATVYIPSWQREYNSGIEIGKTIFGLLLFAVGIFGGAAALSYYLSVPMSMPNQQTKISYAQGPITITWSVSVQKRIIPIPLFGLIPIVRFRWLGRTAVSDLMEGLISTIQLCGLKIKTGEEMHKDFARLFEELNFALVQERAGEEYDKLMRKRLVNIPERQRYVMSIVAGVVKELHDLEKRFETTVFKFVVLENFAEMGSELEQYFANERRKKSKIESDQLAEAAEATERGRIVRDLQAEFERQEMAVVATGEMVAKQVNAYCARRGITLDSQEAAKAGESFLGRETVRLRLEAQERLRKLELEAEQEKTRGQTAVGTDTAQAQMLQARAWQTGMDALEKLLGSLDIQTILASALQQRQEVAERSKLGGENE